MVTSSSAQQSQLGEGEDGELSWHCLEIALDKTFSAGSVKAMAPHWPVMNSACILCSEGFLPASQDSNQVLLNAPPFPPCEGPKAKATVGVRPPLPGRGTGLPKKGRENTSVVLVLCAPSPVSESELACDSH